MSKDKTNATGFQMTRIPVRTVRKSDKVVCDMVYPASYHEEKVTFSWFPDKKEWKALIDYYCLEGYTHGTKDEESYHRGPLDLDESMGSFIIDTYGISTEKIGEKDAIRTCPEDLERLVDEKHKINFSIRCGIANDTDDNTIDWIRNENKWVKANKEVGLCNHWFLDYRFGINDPDYRILLNAFGIKRMCFSKEGYLRISPADLARMGKKDPVSCTLGDERYASEVR